MPNYENSIWDGKSQLLLLIISFGKNPTLIKQFHYPFDLPT